MKEQTPILSQEFQKPWSQSSQQSSKVCLTIPTLQRRELRIRESEQLSGNHRASVSGQTRAPAQVCLTPGKLPKTLHHTFQGRELCLIIVFYTHSVLNVCS